MVTDFVDLDGDGDGEIDSPFSDSCHRELRPLVSKRRVRANACGQWVLTEEEMQLTCQPLQASRSEFGDRIRRASEPLG